MSHAWLSSLNGVDFMNGNLIETEQAGGTADHDWRAPLLRGSTNDFMIIEIVSVGDSPNFHHLYKTLLILICKFCTTEFKSYRLSSEGAHNCWVLYRYPMIGSYFSK